MSQHQLPRQSVAHAARWMLVSAVAFTFMSLWVKKMGPEAPHAVLVFARGFVNLLIILGLHVFNRKIEFIPGNWKLLIARGVAGFFGVSALYYGVRHLPLPVATLLSWSSPLFVLLFSRILLQEILPRGALPLVALSWLSLIGVSELSLESGLSTRIPIYSVMFVLSGAMAAGFAYTVIRAASSAVSSETIIFYFSWVTVVLAGIWMMMSQSYTLSSEQMCQVVEMGVFASIGQISMTRAYLYAPASYVSQMSLLNPVLGAGLGVLYLNEMLSIQQWLGVMGLFVSLSGISYLQMKGIEKEI